MPKPTIHLIGALLIAVALAACGSGEVSPQVQPAPTDAPLSPATVTATEQPAAERPSGTSAALTIPCAELVPASELERMIGARPENLLETTLKGWTACTWFYTPAGAAQQSEFMVQAYTGEETLVKWRMDTTNRSSGFVVNSLADYVQEGYTWVIPESKLRAVQALQDGRYVFLRFPADNLALGTESTIADYLAVLFRRLAEKG